MSPAELGRVVDSVLDDIPMAAPVDVEDCRTVRDAIVFLLAEPIAKYHLSVEVYHRHTDVFVQVLDGGHRLVIRRIDLATGTREKPRG